MKNKIYLFGAEAYCREVIQSGFLNDYEIIAIADDDPGKWGLVFEGYPVIEPKTDYPYPVFIVSRFHVEIVYRLFSSDIKKFSVIRKTTDMDYLKLDYDLTKYSKSDITEIDNQVLLFTRDRSGSNTGCFFYMLNDRIKNHRFYSIVQCGDENEMFYINIFRSKIIVLDIDHMVFPRDKVVIQLWHGFGPKGSGYMNSLLAGQDDKLEDAHKRWLRYTRVCSYGGMYNTVMSACFGLPSEKFTITGMPRNDVLLLSDGKKNLTELFPECRGKTIIVYMPTFRRAPGRGMSGRERGYFYNFEDFEWEKFDGYCQKNDIFFIIKHHPFEKISADLNKLNNIRSLHDNELGDLDFYHYLSGADILMTDYSSVYIDFLLLNRPIFFCSNDETEYGDERGFVLTPLDFWQPGPKIKSTDGFKTEIAKIFSGEDEFYYERDLIRSLTHVYDDAKSSERICDMINEMIYI